MSTIKENVCNPVVTVLMAVHNGELHLQEAVSAIMSQTFTDFEFFLVDDGSTDQTRPMLREYERQDNRISVLFNETNQGLARSLNRGLDNAKGEFIARMDADDDCHPERLAKQVSFLKNSLEIGVCGTWTKIIDDELIWRTPTDDAHIRCNLLFGPSLAHPSVMIRKSLLDTQNARYDSTYRQSQDYELWSRLAQHTRFANLPEVLVYRRQHQQQVSVSKRSQQDHFADQVRLTNLRRLNLQPSASEQDLHNRLARGELLPTKNFVQQTNTWFQNILKANRISGAYPQSTLTDVLAQRWFLVCRQAVVQGRWVWNTFWESPLSQNVTLPYSTKAKFALLALFGKNR